MLDIMELKVMKEQACKDLEVALNLIVEATDELITTAVCEHVIRYGVEKDFDVGEYLVELKLIPNEKVFDEIVECYENAIDLHSKFQQEGGMGSVVFSNLPLVACRLADNIISYFESSDMLSCSSTAEYVFTCLPIFYDSMDKIPTDSCMLDAVMKVCLEMVNIEDRLGVLSRRESDTLLDLLSRYLSVEISDTLVRQRVVESVRKMMGYLLSEYEQCRNGKGWG